MTPRRWFKKLMTTSDKVLSVFYSVEKDKGDPKSSHVHTLINSSTDISYEQFRSGLGVVAGGDYDLIKDPEEVANYVTKYFGVYDVDYDFLLKEDRTQQQLNYNPKSFAQLSQCYQRGGVSRTVFFKELYAQNSM